MSCCACCCFYPKYKKKVDNIYPRHLDSPLIKIEVEKLQYYVKQHPEKLSKVGEYLYQNLKWGLAGAYKNRNYVKNTIEAVDKILVVITPQNLNYYAGNYLKIIQKLLEQSGANMAASNSLSDGINSHSSNSNSNTNTNNNINNNNNNINTNNDYLEYQRLASSLFRKFCDKEAANQSTSNYNLNYDTFVCQFSSMCYNNNKDEGARAEIRSSGLKCLATMVKRLVPDDSLRAGYLWDNMDKIVPALLFIMHENYLMSSLAHSQSIDMENQYEEINEIEEAQLDRSLDRYLYGDFFINSRTHTHLSKPDTNCNLNENDANANSDLDNVRVEFRKNDKYSVDKFSDLANGNNSEDRLQMEESGATILLNRKNSHDLVDPDHEAKMLLKNLAFKADYTTISKIVIPILAYLDSNNPSGWEYARFVRCVFLILMYNVKQQHAIVIKELIKHLDSHINSSARLKCHIIRAISTCIRIAAMHSVGTAGQTIEIFTYLLKFLKTSVEKASTLRSQLITKKSSTPTVLISPSTNSLQTVTGAAGAAGAASGNGSYSNGDSTAARLNSDLNEELNLQRRIINAMGQFTMNLPDYSKNDVVMFIARQINSQQFSYVDLPINNNSQTNQITQQIAKEQQICQLRAKYFECLLEICTKYRPSQLFSAFTSVPFLEDILRLTLVNDWASRRKAHEIMHHLLDKYQLLAKIKHFKPSLFNELTNSSSGIVVIKKDMLSKSTSSFNRLSLAKIESNNTLNKVDNPKGLKESSSTSSLNNLKTSRNKTYLSQLDLNETKLSKEDVQFMRKHGRLFLAHLNENLFLANNRRENYESI